MILMFKLKVFSGIFFFGFYLQQRSVRYKTGQNELKSNRFNIYFLCELRQNMRHYF